MPTRDDYWEARALASLTADQITADLKDHWRVGRGGRTTAYSVGLMNAAFRIYYAGVAFAKALRNPASGQALPQGRGLSDVLLDDLRGPRRGLAYVGSGGGVSDLDEAFDHLAANGGRWTDDNHEDYNGTIGQLGGVRFGVTAEFAANFLKEVDDRQKALSESGEFQAATRALANDLTRCQRLRNANRIGTRDWQQLGERLDAVKTAVTNTQRYLWLGPALAAAAGTDAASLTDRAGSWFNENVLGHAGRLLEAVSVVRSSVESYDRAIRGGFGRNEAAALTALTAVVGKLPVLGDLYAAALDTLPSIASTFRSIAERQAFNVRIARYGATPGMRVAR